MVGTCLQIEGVSPRNSGILEMNVDAFSTNIGVLFRMAGVVNQAAGVLQDMVAEGLKMVGAIHGIRASCFSAAVIPLVTVQSDVGADSVTRRTGITSGAIGDGKYAINKKPRKTGAFNGWMCAAIRLYSVPPLYRQR